LEIVVIEEGTTRNRTDEQCENAEIPRFEIFPRASNVNSKTFSQWMKHDLAIVSTVEGI
jgi:hypothetical protein